LARSVAPYFRVGSEEADDIIEQQRQVVSQWRTIATSLGISSREQERQSDAFRLA
jgi:serine/threonine-protein kinase HipA